MGSDLRTSNIEAALGESSVFAILWLNVDSMLAQCWASVTTFQASRCIKASFYMPENILHFLTTKGFRKILESWDCINNNAIFF